MLVTRIFLAIFMSNETDVLQQFLNINKIFSEYMYSYCIVICDQNLFHNRAEIMFGRRPNTLAVLLINILHYIALGPGTFKFMETN